MIGAIEAADAMVKTANVVLTGKESSAPGWSWCSAAEMWVR